MGVPEDIRKVRRPKNTVVIDTGIGEKRYVVRERVDVIYVKGGNPRPRNGKVIGHILNGKYVPNDSSQHKLKNIRQIISYGGCEFAWSLCSDIKEDLLSIYGADADTILTIAILRATRPGIKDSKLASFYDENYISRLVPNVKLSAPKVSSFLKLLGGNQSLMKEFLKKRVNRVSADQHIAIDGTLKQDTSEINDLSGYSFKSRVKGSRDISVLYAYNIEEREAICFDVYPGNMIDATSYKYFIERNGLNKGIIVDDKGFPVNSAKEAFDKNPELGFLTPLKRNDQRIEGNNMTEFDSSITYRGKVIACIRKEIIKGKRWLYAYKDSYKAAKEEKDWLLNHDSEEMGNEKYKEEYNKHKNRFGTIVMESNRELTCLQAYEAYAQRWLIELTFRQYKQALDLDSTRVQYNSSVYGTELINFIATIISERMIEKMDKASLLKEDSYGDVMRDLNGVMKLEENGKFVEVITNPRCLEIMKKLDI